MGSYAKLPILFLADRNTVGAGWHQLRELFSVTTSGLSLSALLIPEPITLHYHQSLRRVAASRMSSSGPQ
jgi:hypothetical protein